MDFVVQIRGVILYQSNRFLELNQLTAQHLKDEISYLEYLLNIVEKELAQAPPGSLTIRKKDSHIWYYHRNSAPAAKPIYLNKSRRNAVYALAQKNYDLKLKRALTKELQKVKKGIPLSFPTLTAIYDSFPDTWKPFIKPHVLPDELFIEEWLKKYRKDASGESFKSKSEWIHKDIFEKYDRPYVYEPRLYLKGYGLVRPDFVILNVRTRQTFYLEHFGMMDDPEYCKKALAKLEAYHRNGFYEGVNLLITMESKGRPMNPEEAEAIVRQYLL